MADLDSVKRRIAALLDKTTARGCTEAEAVAAAAKAAELMREHGLDEACLGMEMADAPASKHPTVTDALWVAIGAYTGCVSVVDTAIGIRSYIGRAPGPTIAAYLHTFLHRYIESAVDRFKASAEYKKKRKGVTRRRACTAFRKGMTDRLRLAVRDHFGAPNPLLIEQAEAERDRRFSGLRTRNVPVPKNLDRHCKSREAGYQAADGVKLRHGVSGSGSGPRMIGGGNG
ncbi:DUF2786 domain-containing protein [Rhodospirillum sp. A1_3_36]|uniref:DUF7168 domain-containing protein n=1 Tax=Rhodospirillum sp. A1_3_36 TaxID=3391666 RepID=UPI0039A6E96F